jgi:hypothetical protein
MELSKQKMMETVIAHKDRIVNATRSIIEKLDSLQASRSSENEKDVLLYVKKQVSQIVSDLSIIGGFCGAREKSLVELSTKLIQIILSMSRGGILSNLIEDWCLEVNGIIVDFTKTPFRFVGAEFGINLRGLEGKIKTIIKR